MEESKEIKNEVCTMDLNEGIIKMKNIILLASCVLLGVVFDYLLIDKNFGISYPIFVICFYGIFLWNLRNRLVCKVTMGYILIIPIMLLSLTYLLFSNEVFGVLNFLAIPALILIQTILVANSNKYEWYKFRFIEDILYAIFVRVFTNLGKPFGVIKGLIRIKSDLGKYNSVLKVLAGLLISIPLMLVVVPLLTSADQVFGELVNRIPNIFKNIDIGDFIPHSIVILIISVFSFSYIWSFINEKIQRVPANPNEIPALKGILDSITVTTVLFCINIIYVLFTAVQFTYLFGKIVPSNFTYSEYARRGFFELIVVTMINLGILLIATYLTKKDSLKINRLLQILNSLLVGCTLVMLLSAFYRMMLYEEAYGYTYLRILTHGFMVFIFVILVISLYKVWNERFLLLKGYIITALAAYLIINYINIDVIIAKNNIERYKNTGIIDVPYLTQLSYDAVPIVIQLMNESTLSTEVQDGLYFRKESLNAESQWQSFNISKYRAKKILEKYDLKSSNAAGR